MGYVRIGDQYGSRMWTPNLRDCIIFGDDEDASLESLGVIMIPANANDDVVDELCRPTQERLAKLRKSRYVSD